MDHHEPFAESVPPVQPGMSTAGPAPIVVPEVDHVIGSANAPIIPPAGMTYAQAVGQMQFEKPEPEIRAWLIIVLALSILAAGGLLAAVILIMK